MDWHPPITINPPEQIIDHIDHKHSMAMMTSKGSAKHSSFARTPTRTTMRLRVPTVLLITLLACLERTQAFSTVAHWSRPLLRASVPPSASSAFSARRQRTLPVLFLVQQRCGQRPPFTSSCSRVSRSTTSTSISTSSRGTSSTSRSSSSSSLDAASSSEQPHSNQQRHQQRRRRRQRQRIIEIRNPVTAAARTLYTALARVARLPPPIQMVVTLACYLFHLTVLTQHAVTFPVQLLPVPGAAATAIGWDSIAGVAALAVYRLGRPAPNQPAPSLDQSLAAAASDQPTTTVAAAAAAPTSTTAATATATKPQRIVPWRLPATNPRHRLSFLVSCSLLTLAYFGTGRFSLYWDDVILEMSAAGWPITAPMHRSLIVLMGHLSWVLAGSTILWILPRPPPFFGTVLPETKAGTTSSASASSSITDSDNDSESKNGNDESLLPGNSRRASNSPAHVWFQSHWHCSWLWWVVGGYFVSSWLFNVADQINQWILPAQVLQQAQESIVSQLVNPEHNDIAASIVGYIAPCLTAPFWEEILYRGFALAGLASFTGGKFHVAAVVQAIVFSAHHMSVTAALPLAVLGWTWAMLYTASRNLWTVVFVHALWNSRVFLGSWLGL